MSAGLFALRLVVGLLMAGHGAQKLFGWLGGNGPGKTGDAFHSMGLRPGRQMAIAAGGSEALGGILIAAGLLTPLGAVLVMATMLVAIATAHWRRGLWSTDGGFEYNLVLIAAAFALAATGPGAWSADNALGIDAAGLPWALGALALASFGSTAVIVLGRADLPFARRTARSRRQGRGGHAHPA
jgi:putative oxidoreductase